MVGATCHLKDEVVEKPDCDPTVKLCFKEFTKGHKLIHASLISVVNSFLAPILNKMVGQNGSYLS